MLHSCPWLIFSSFKFNLVSGQKANQIPHVIQKTDDAATYRMTYTSRTHYGNDTKTVC